MSDAAKPPEPASDAAPIRLLVLPGDGIGPEISAATVAVVREAGRLLDLPFAFGEAEIGFAALEASGTTFP